MKTSMFTFIKPLKIAWAPQKDITTYELAMCVPILLAPGPLMPSDIVDYDQPYLRNFIIENPNITT